MPKNHVSLPDQEDHTGRQEPASLQPSPSLQDKDTGAETGIDKECVFCQIAAGTIPGHLIFEDNLCVVLLDIHPANPGHLLIIPKKHYPIMPLVPDSVVHHLFSVVQKMSKALLHALSSEGATILIANGKSAGQKAPHAMIHLIPRKEGDGLALSLPVRDFPPEVLQAAGEKIYQEVQKKLST